MGASLDTEPRAAFLSRMDGMRPPILERAHILRGFVVDARDDLPELKAALMPLRPATRDAQIFLHVLQSGYGAVDETVFAGVVFTKTEQMIIPIWRTIHPEDLKQTPEALMRAFDSAPHVLRG